MLFSVSVNSIFSYLHLSLFTLSANIRCQTVNVQYLLFWMVHPKTKVLSSFTNGRVILYNFFAMKQVEVVGFFQAITGKKDLGFQASWRQNIAACKKYKCSFCWIFQALRSNDNLNPLCEEQTIIQMCVTDNISFQWAVFRCKQII